MGGCITYLFGFNILKQLTCVTFVMIHNTNQSMLIFSSHLRQWLASLCCIISYILVMLLVFHLQLVCCCFSINIVNYINIVLIHI